MRLLIYVCLMFLVMVFVLHMFGPPSRGRYMGDNGSSLHDPQLVHPPPQSHNAPPGSPPSSKAPSSGFNDLTKAKGMSASSRSFDGPLRFPKLSASLQAIGSTDGALPVNRNILFAAASMRSVSNLLPFACRMAEEKTNYVHFAFILNTEIPIAELLKINGIDKKCPLITHGKLDVPVFFLLPSLTIYQTRDLMRYLFLPIGAWRGHLREQCVRTRKRLLGGITI